MKGKVAIITASSTGIGKGIALRLAQEGVKVVISSRNQKHIDETVNEIKKQGYEAHGIVCHVGKKEDRSRLIRGTLEKWGRLDYLVPNAAVSTQMGSFVDATDDQIQKMLEINYKSTFFLIQEALPHLKEQKDSAIVILASYAAYDLPGLIGHYAVTKTMLVAMTKILAKELLDDEIRVNCVCPGLIKTGFSQALWSQGEENAAKGMGVLRLGVPEDISGVVKFLLSKDASYMTGESVVVAGRPCARL
jgi:dehydrogenase/reductase SDR family member 4